MAGGAWVHVFPEGHVGYSGRLEPCRWGVGRLVCDAAVAAGRCGMQYAAYAALAGRRWRLCMVGLVIFPASPGRMHIQMYRPLWCGGSTPLDSPRAQMITACNPRDPLVVPF